MAQSKRKFSRKYDIVSEYPVVFIFTEGKTEENYFRSICRELKLVSVRFQKDIIEIEKTGRSTSSLVKYADKNRDGADEVWVVFDRDDQKDFNAAMLLAGSKNISVAYSNECFELWFLLHFEYVTTANGRNSYPERLSVLLSRKYEKVDEDVYDSIRGGEANAIKYAKKLELLHDSQGTTSATKRDPSTTVYRLVERLRGLKG